MNRFIRLACKEWEKTLFWGFLFLLVIVLGLWLAGFAENEGDLVSTRSAPQRTSLLGSNAFAFREVPPGMDFTTNPFGFVRRVQSKSERPWQGDPEAKSETPTTNTAATTPKEAPPKQDPPPQPKQEPKEEPKADPPKPKRFIAVHYRGMYEGPSQKRLAFIRTTDSESKQKLSKPVEKGADIEGIVFSDFTESTLTVLQPNGKELTIPIGAQKRIFVE